MHSCEKDPRSKQQRCLSACHQRLEGPRSRQRRDGRVFLLPQVRGRPWGCSPRRLPDGRLCGCPVLRCMLDLVGNGLPFLVSSMGAPKKLSANPHPRGPCCGLYCAISCVRMLGVGSGILVARARILRKQVRPYSSTGVKENSMDTTSDEGPAKPAALNSFDQFCFLLFSCFA